MKEKLLSIGITPPLGLLKISCNCFIPKGSVWTQIPVQLSSTALAKLNDLPVACYSFEVRNPPGPDEALFSVQTSEIHFSHLSLSRDPVRDALGPPSCHIHVRNVSNDDIVLTEDDIVAAIHRPSIRAVSTRNNTVNLRELALFAASSEYADPILNGSQFTPTHQGPPQGTRFNDVKPVILFLGNSLDTLNHVQGSLASDGRTHNVVAVISQNASLRCDSTPFFSCKDDLIQNTDSVISFLNSSLEKDTIVHSTVLGFLETSLSNRGSVESRSESGCRRLVETSMGISIANRLHTPFIGS